MADNRTGSSDGFTAEEKAAMKARSAELRAEKAAQRSANKAAAAEKTVLDAIAAMPDDDRAIAERIHTLVRRTAPELGAKTWYGMPAYTNAESKVVLFFQAASKFGSRYATLGFNDDANLDDGPMWATAYAIVELTPEVEERVVELIRHAVS